MDAITHKGIDDIIFPMMRDKENLLVAEFYGRLTDAVVIGRRMAERVEGHSVKDYQVRLEIVSDLATLAMPSELDETDLVLTWVHLSGWVWDLRHHPVSEYQLTNIINALYEAALEVLCHFVLDTTSENLYTYADKVVA